MEAGKHQGLPAFLLASPIEKGMALGHPFSFIIAL
jgi:hypothetical protein